jgi:phosphopantothenoylcysteine decarboxylase/phosphopantothenate--cysteine ligase
MSTLLRDKAILFGVTGGIAAYKAVSWVRDLVREGARVTVVMTESATRFVTPLTFAALSGNRVYTDMFDENTAEAIPHIALGRARDLVVVAPATARTMARLAHGLADDFLTTAVMATTAPVLLFPAMNNRMWEHPANQVNLATLQGYGYAIVEPACGSLACGDEGPGRLADWDTAREAMLARLSVRDLAGRTVLVTAGPTREALDPVRHLSNRSSGRMGFWLARVAARRGARVILVTGPTSLPAPPGIETVRVESGLEMRQAVVERLDQVSVVVKAAAVSDYRPQEMGSRKLKKGAATMSLGLAMNPDILKELGELKQGGKCLFLAGFAAESHDHLAEGRRKLAAKHLDLMVVNDISGSDTGFAVETNRVTLLDREGGEEELPLLSKEETAERIWDRIVKLL